MAKDGCDPQFRLPVSILCRRHGIYRRMKSQMEKKLKPPPSATDIRRLWCWAVILLASLYYVPSAPSNSNTSLIIENR